MTPHEASLAYLATPYSKWRYGIIDAFEKSAVLAARLMIEGVKVYSPICHTHPMAIYGGLDPYDHSIWLPFDEQMMHVASILLIAHMDGWQDSNGIAYEINFFERTEKPIFDLDPETLTMTRRDGAGKTEPDP